MSDSIDFAPSYDFSDENFIQIKDGLFNELKKDFLLRIEKARDKQFVLENEKNAIAALKKRTTEVYGSILLSEFDDCFKSGAKTIQVVIGDFVTFYSKTSTDWVKMYQITTIQNNVEFKKFGSEREFELLVLMTAWAKENKDFNGQPNENNNCPVDITRTDAVHYFEKLAGYQAKREYGAFIDGFEIAKEVGDIDKPSKGNGEYTIARQILAIRHVLIEFGLLEAYTNNSDIARLVHLFAGKEVAKVANSAIYDRMKKLNATEKMDMADYQFVIRHFEKLNAPAGSAIDNIINRLKKDMK